MNKKMNKKGFTIVELVIVIAVIAILAAVLIPTFAGVVGKANNAAAIAEVRNAYSATIAAEAETGNYVIGNHSDAIVVQATNGKLVSIGVDGSYTVVDSGTAGYKVDGGKIVSNG